MTPSEPQTAPKVSVVLLSHRRPHLLSRVLHAVAQLDYPNFEVVVVGDQRSIHDYGLPDAWATHIRYAYLAEQDICKARNVGIQISGGEIVAFCDDDAVPEPDWLTELVVPFQTAKVGAVAGAVRGANGLRMEWTGGWFDRTGRETPAGWTSGLKIANSHKQIANSRFLALMGVNTAFRRDALVSVGGFDEAYVYYLDETDLALRLARAGWSAAYVAAAQVHHLREANVARDALKTPRSLYQIAASKSYFCHRHLAPSDVAPALAAFHTRRVAELDPYIRLGTLRRAGRDALIKEMEKGIVDGAVRHPSANLDRDEPPPVFQPFRPATRPLRLALITGWGVGPVMRARKAARRLADAGYAMTCISYLSGPQPLSVTYDRGVWLHRGGTWQAIDILRRGAPLGRYARAQAELARVSRHRKFDVLLQCGRAGTAENMPIAADPRFGPMGAQVMALAQSGLPAAVHEISSVLSNIHENTHEKVSLTSRMPEAERLDLVQDPLVSYTQPRAGAGG